MDDRLTDLDASTDPRPTPPADDAGQSPGDTSRPAAPRQPAFRGTSAFGDTPAFRGDSDFRDDRFDDPAHAAAYGATGAYSATGASTLDEVLQADDRPLARPLTRLGARLIDGALGGLSVVPGLLIIALLGEGGIFLAAAGLIAFVIYNLVLLANEGQTIGKRMLKLRIVNAADGGNPGFAQAALVRGLANWFIGVFIPLYSLVDVLFIFRDDRRCIHDMLAKTIVVTEAEGI